MQHRCDIHILLAERRRCLHLMRLLLPHLRLQRVVQHAHHVMVHQHLSTAVRASTNANRGNVNAARQDIAHDLRHTLDHDGEAACLLQATHILYQTHHRINYSLDKGQMQTGLALHLEATQLPHGLRRQADVSQNGNAALRQRIHFVLTTHTTLQLDAIDATLLHHTYAVVDALRNGFFLAMKDTGKRNVGAKRHIANDHGVFRSSR